MTALARPLDAVEPGCQARLLTPDALSRRAAAWDRLVAGAADPHPFYARQVVEAHLRNGVGDGPGFLSVRDGDELLALLPFVLRGRVGVWRACAGGWASPYTCDGTPLVVAHRLEEAVAALLDGMARLPSPLWLLPGIALEGRTVRAIRAELHRRGWPQAVLSAAPRPVLERRADYPAYNALLSRSRRKGLRRQAARLAAFGAVEHRAAENGPELAAALDAFLALEAAGWKGRRGTALAATPATAGLARHLFAAAPGPVRPRADLLTLDGRPIAVSLALVCGETAYLLKGAYDESLRACGPGILLEDAIARALHGQGFARRLDSCALPGTPLDGLHPDRVMMGDLLLGAGPIDRRRFAAIVEAETLRRTQLAGAKSRAGELRLWADAVRSRLRIGWRGRPAAEMDPA